MKSFEKTMGDAEFKVTLEKEEDVMSVNVYDVETKNIKGKDVKTYNKTFVQPVKDVTEGMALYNAKKSNVCGFSGDNKTTLRDLVGNIKLK